MSNTKEVYFVEYCSKCEHYNKADYEEPCNNCLAQPFMMDSHKPMNFKEKTTK